MAKTKREYKSMRGKVIDMDLLQKKHELTPAVGNAKVNARGDEIGPGGKIIKKREDIVKEYYQGAGVSDESGRFKKTDNKTATKAEDLTEEEIKMLDEAADDDSWIEDENGNFVQKGE